MGLTDILGKLGGQQGQQGGLSAISQLFGGNGLQGIMSTLQSNGLGKQVQSWIGTGQNQPISGQELQQAVDPQMLQQMAQQQGMTPDEFSSHVAQALPDVVDQATPNGQVPQQGGLGALKNLLNM